MTMHSPGTITARQLHHAAHQRAVTTPDNYYSRGRFTPGAIAANVATIVRAKARCFAYAEGAVMDAATPGEAGTIATSADTNLVGAGGQTIGGHELEIYGLSMQLEPRSQSGRLTALLWSESCVTIVYNGKEIGLQVGPPFFIPGQSSLYGIGSDVGLEPPIPGGGNGPQGAYPYASNGLPGASNFMKIPEGLLWTSAGRADSNMTIVVELTRDIAQTLPVTEAAAAGIRGFTQPLPAALAVDFMIKLHARVTRARSRNI